jgi:hypothetical protein
LNGAPPDINCLARRCSWIGRPFQTKLRLRELESAETSNAPNASFGALKLIDCAV